MARPREFDEGAALQSATQRFWLHGFAGSSVRDLADSMGITGASLYNAFGDKRGLYRRAFEHYVQAGFRERVRRLEDLPPRAAIEAFLEEIVQLSVSDPQHKGCLIVNSALELSPVDPEFQALIATVLRDMENFFHRCVNAGQKDGSINDALRPRDLARMLLSVLLGLRVLARSRPEPELLRGALRPVLALLEPAHGVKPRKKP
jgi:TetR/AcrR family transcriptional regulator, transcriptional repressor for nem operon